MGTFGNPADYWKYVGWSDGTKIKLSGNSTTQHVWRRNASVLAQSRLLKGRSGAIHKHNEDEMQVDLPTGNDPKNAAKEITKKGNQGVVMTQSTFH